MIPVDGSGDAATTHTGRDALPIYGMIGDVGVSGVADIGHEEMSILTRVMRVHRRGGWTVLTGQRRHRGDKEAGGGGRRAIGDARNIGDLDDVGGTGEDAGGGRGGSMGGGTIVAPGDGGRMTAFLGPDGIIDHPVALGLGLALATLLLLLPLAAGLDAKSPEEPGGDADEDDTTDDAAGNGTNVRRTMRIRVGSGGRGSR